MLIAFFQLALHRPADTAKLGYQLQLTTCVLFQMLHEQIRTYKRDLYDTQASNKAHDRHIVRLQAELKRMHEALQVSFMQCPAHVS